jgi:hypothetical protein
MDEVGAEVKVSINPMTRRPWTDEERAAQSERTKQMVKEGKFGGARHGRRKKLPAYAVIAAQAQKHGRELAATLLDIALHGATEQVQMAAIRMLTDMEMKVQSNRREEEDHLLKLPREELQRLVLERLASLTGEDYDIELPAGEFEEVDDDENENDEGEEGDDEAEA